MDIAVETESRRKRLYHKITGSLVIALGSTLSLFLFAFFRSH